MISSQDGSVNVNKNTISPDTLNIYKNTRLNIFLKLQRGKTKSKKKNLEIKREITKAEKEMKIQYLYKTFTPMTSVLIIYCSCVKVI